MTKPQSQTQVDEPQGPAIERPGHVWGRPATDDQMRPIVGKVGCTKWTPLESYFNQGRLDGGDPRYSATARFNAGNAYEKVWDTAQASGRDSTQALNISRSHGGTPLSQARSDAIRALVAVDSHLSQRTRIIIRKVCGEGMFPSEAVAMVSIDYTKATAARFREALDELIEAWETVRRHPGKFNVSREAS